MKVTERMRRVQEDDDDALTTKLANQACQKLQGVGMGKVDKFELEKGVAVFEVGMDLQRYLGDTVFPKVRIPEGGAEVHHRISHRKRP